MFMAQRNPSHKTSTRCTNALHSIWKILILIAAPRCQIIHQPMQSKTSYNKPINICKLKLKWECEPFQWSPNKILPHCSSANNMLSKSVKSVHMHDMSNIQTVLDLDCLLDSDTGHTNDLKLINGPEPGTFTKFPPSVNTHFLGSICNPDTEMRILQSSRVHKQTKSCSDSKLKCSECRPWPK